MSYETFYSVTINGNEAAIPGILDYSELAKKVSITIYSYFSMRYRSQELGSIRSFLDRFATRMNWSMEDVQGIYCRTLQQIGRLL